MRSGGRTERELNEAERDQLEAMLRQVSLERSSIREAMAWCVQRSAASDEIAETLTDALTLKQTPVPKKLARLFLLSDILHNSSAAVPNASSYRTHFQASLPAIFTS